MTNDEINQEMACLTMGEFCGSTMIEKVGTIHLHHLFNPAEDLGQAFTIWDCLIESGTADPKTRSLHERQTGWYISWTEEGVPQYGPCTRTPALAICLGILESIKSDGLLR